MTANPCVLLVQVYNRSAVRPIGGGKMADYQRLSALDRSFLDLEGPDTPMHVGGLFVFEATSVLRTEGAVDLDTLHDYVASRLHQQPRYRQRLAWIPLENHPVWVDDPEFDVRDHVRVLRAPAPGDETSLAEVCSRIFSYPLDRGRPLWEMWFVSGLENDRIALVVKVHHCMVDGVAGMGLLQSLLSITPEKEIEPAPPWRSRPLPGGARLLTEALVRRVDLSLGFGSAVLDATRRPVEALRELADSALGLAGIARRGLVSASPTPINTAVGPERAFRWLACDLEEVKRIRRAYECTLNDVVLAVAAGAVGSYFDQQGLSRREQEGLDFRAYCPVDVRGGDTSLGNRVSALIAPLPISLRSPSERLRSVARTMRRLKASREARGAEVAAKLTDWTFPALMGSLSRLGFSRRASNLLVSNVPGPPVPLYLLGARLLECYPLVPLFPGQGLAIALFSYAGGLYWGLNSDRFAFREAGAFVDALDVAFRELAEAAALDARR